MRSWFHEKNIVDELLGGIIFSVGDMAHIAFKMAHYSPEAFRPFSFFNIPWWVPLEFFIAGFLLLATFPIRRNFFKLEKRQSKIGDVVFSFSLSLLLYLLTSFIPEDFYLFKNLALFFILLFQVRWLKLSGINSWLEFFWIAINGCGFEFMLGRLGIFQYYPSPSLVYSIPIWLWLIYMSVAVTIRTAYESL